MSIFGKCQKCGGQTKDYGCLDCITSERDSLTLQVRDLKGAMAAQDEREQKAGALCGVKRDEHGCDWPDAVAEALVCANRQIDELKKVVEIAREVAECHSCLSDGMGDPKLSVLRGVFKPKGLEPEMKDDLTFKSPEGEALKARGFKRASCCRPHTPGMSCCCGCHSR